MIWTRVSVLVAVIASSALCLSQDATSGGPDSIIAGPFGEPRMVMSEGGEWSYPIKVFADSKVETFVPDITSPGWVSWHVAEFRQEGTYFTYLYIYHRKSRNTGRETVYVNTRTNTAMIVRPLVPPIQVDISKAPLELSQSISKTTALVKEDAERFRGSTVQEDILREKSVVAKMALCSGSGGSNPDCGLSDSEFLKKHPVYSGTSPQLIPGAVPGVNCGVGTERSCCCADNPAASSSPAAPLAAQTDAIAREDGLYRVGGRVSPPVPLNSVNAGYTDEARRAKYQGLCKVAVIVDAQGNPRNPRVIRGLGMGLNEKAMEAVSKYKFKPAMLDGKTPVPVMITVEVNFRLY